MGRPRRTSWLLGTALRTEILGRNVIEIIVLSLRSLSAHFEMKESLFIKAPGQLGLRAKFGSAANRRLYQLGKA